MRRCFGCGRQWTVATLEQPECPLCDTPMGALEAAQAFLDDAEGALTVAITEGRVSAGARERLRALIKELNRGEVGSC